MTDNPNLPIQNRKNLQGEVEPKEKIVLSSFFKHVVLENRMNTKAVRDFLMKAKNIKSVLKVENIQVNSSNRKGT